MYVPNPIEKVPFVCCLVKDLEQITSCPFYWGKLGRFEAECLLRGKPAGTFLLRDSIQHGVPYAVSWSRYGIVEHSRITVSFGVYSFAEDSTSYPYQSDTVLDLLAYYKRSKFTQFLIMPLRRHFVASLKQIARAKIVSRTTYEGVSQLNVSNVLKDFLREYHYIQYLCFNSDRDRSNYVKMMIKLKRNW